ncbi:hypothetical protein GF312_13610, partial [Candidatus Poribacteria bacterium]|nr:hypothetical protein [Candidatus Poribacteria bacterium]
LIEDVAQSAGVKWKGQKTGTFGQLACFSLGRGKSLTTYEGGVLGIRDESLVKFFDEEIDNIKPQDRISSLKNFVKLSSMGLLQNPRAWWFVSKLPLGFEQQYHSIDFKIERLCNWQAAFGNLVLKHLDEINETRVRNGKYLIDHLRLLRDIKIPEESEDAETVYLRLPIIFNTPEQREFMYNRLNKAGIGTSRFYRCSLNRYDYLRSMLSQGEYPVAQYIADRILALPTHPLIKKRDMDLIIEVFKQNVRS